jgi:hypothetical protein
VTRFSKFLALCPVRSSSIANGELIARALVAIYRIARNGWDAARALKEAKMNEVCGRGIADCENRLKRSTLP